MLPAFLEFARDTVLVAHNAPFDMGFLKAACAAQERPWPAPAVVDTADLARRLLTRDEVPNCKLSTLARFFRAATEPCHRALADARATVDVLHGLLERAGAFGVESLEELRSFARAPTPEQKRKRHLADAVPAAPGVYIFEDARGEPLYVGKSGRLRTRVRSYFTASETRRGVREMIGIAERVRTIVCASALEAEVRELRLIAAHKPRYNRRSRHPERAVWLKLTRRPVPAAVHRARGARRRRLLPRPVRQHAGRGGGARGRARRRAAAAVHPAADAPPDRRRPGRHVRARRARPLRRALRGPAEPRAPTPSTPRTPARS